MILVLSHSVLNLYFFGCLLRRVTWSTKQSIWPELGKLGDCWMMSCTISNCTLQGCSMSMYLRSLRRLSSSEWTFVVGHGNLIWLWVLWNVWQMLRDKSRTWTNHVGWKRHKRQVPTPANMTVLHMAGWIWQKEIWCDNCTLCNLMWVIDPWLQAHSWSCQNCSCPEPQINS